jgi:hypothetical protein
VTTSVQSLASWLTERIAEDEAEARNAEQEITPFGAWTPTQVLADAEAKRRIVELHGWMGPVMAGAPVDDPKWCITCADHTVSGSPPLDWPCLTLRLLAVPYADRPGYDERWKP